MASTREHPVSYREPTCTHLQVIGIFLDLGIQSPTSTTSPLPFSPRANVLSRSQDIETDAVDVFFSAWPAAYCKWLQREHVENVLCRTWSVDTQGASVEPDEELLLMACVCLGLREKAKLATDHCRSPQATEDPSRLLSGGLNAEGVPGQAYYVRGMEMIAGLDPSFNTLGEY